MNYLNKGAIMTVAAISISGCAAGYQHQAPDGLVSTDLFVSNVLEEHGVIQRRNTTPIPGACSDTGQAPDAGNWGLFLTVRMVP